MIKNKVNPMLKIVIIGGALLVLFSMGGKKEVQLCTSVEPAIGGFDLDELGSLVGSTCERDGESIGCGVVEPFDNMFMTVDVIGESCSKALLDMVGGDTFSSTELYKNIRIFNIPSSGIIFPIDTFYAFCNPSFNRGHVASSITTAKAYIDNYYECHTRTITTGSGCSRSTTQEDVECVDTLWDPSPFEICDGESFTQISNCGTTMANTGTKYCEPDEPDLCDTVTPSVMFTAQRMFLVGNPIIDEVVRAIKLEPSPYDLPSVSTNQGVIDLISNNNYLFIYALNSNEYYPEGIYYTAPCTSAIENKLSQLCKIDTTPTITVYDGNNDIVSPTNKLVIGADNIQSISVNIEVSADECYGNPHNGNNAICFKYDTSKFDSVSTDTGAQSVSYDISAFHSEAGKAISCYNLANLEDNGNVDITITIDSSADPIDEHIEILLDDLSMDVDEDNLNLINGFEDEDNNGLGAPVVVGTIYIE